MFDDTRWPCRWRGGEIGRGEEIAAAVRRRRVECGEAEAAVTTASSREVAVTAGDDGVVRRSGGGMRSYRCR